ncbi:hypothetical protein M9435_003757 [Picochlorum sp. BPE23]|nr:hypothetical protein M9435_003757 [Picochlorum sp. BPE23]
MNSKGHVHEGILIPKDSKHYILHNAGVPVCCWEDEEHLLGCVQSQVTRGKGHSSSPVNGAPHVNGHHHRHHHDKKHHARGHHGHGTHGLFVKGTGVVVGHRGSPVHGQEKKWTRAATPVSVDGIAIVDIEVYDERIVGIYGCGENEEDTYVYAMPRWKQRRVDIIDLKGKFLLPTFVDLHTHIDKGHTAERSRNPTGNLSGADRSTAADAAFWDAEDVECRMEFSVRCAYAHGTSALRTHLINMTDKHIELTWPAFAKIRDRWKGRVELQGVSLVALSFFRDEDAARKLADVVAEHGGLLGAAVCCAEQGGMPEDDWTTCDKDRDLLLDRIFTLAKERNLDIDFHTDENGNELARGLRYVAEKTLKYGYQGRVVCGHCCSLAYQPEHELRRTLAVAAKAGVTVVSLPLVNQWTQDRHGSGGRTPRWRGITLLHEARQAGVPVAIASDNTRDQFYAYGDLDMLEVFNQGCRMAHLDRPYGTWVQSVTSTPANAMRVFDHGRIRVGCPANFIIFPTARRYSELLSRPQYDRIVVRNGSPIDTELPSYEELDYIPNAVLKGQVPSSEVSYDRVSGAVIWKTRVASSDPHPVEKRGHAMVSNIVLKKSLEYVNSTNTAMMHNTIGILQIVEWIVFLIVTFYLIHYT